VIWLSNLLRIGKQPLEIFVDFKIRDVLQRQQLSPISGSARKAISSIDTEKYRILTLDLNDGEYRSQMSQMITGMMQPTLSQI
jgi:hypothetical protein